MATRRGHRPDDARANSGVSRYGAALSTAGRRGGGEAVTSSALLPSDPVSRFSVFLFQTTWTPGGLRGRGRESRSPPPLSPVPPGLRPRACLK